MSTPRPGRFDSRQRIRVAVAEAVAAVVGGVEESEL